MKKYRVLSVRQPYASLLVSGVKDIENRSRRTSYRGTVLIHASAKMHDIVDHMRETKNYLMPFTSMQQRIYSTAVVNESNKETDFSAIIGSVDIVDCVQNHPSEWAEKGQWHWVCENARKFEHPIRDVKGKLGIWEWEGEIEK